MSKSSDNAIPFLLLLISITPFTQSSLVFGSTLSDRIATRPDPLRKFKHYGRDYDIYDKHYWASTAFTGIPGYAVAGVWLLSGLGFAVFVVVKNLNGSASPVVDPPNSSNLIMFFLIVLFTVFAISASSVIIAANQKSLQRAEKLEDTLFGAGNDTSQTIGKVRATLQRMQTSLLPYDSKTCTLLDLIGHRLRKESLRIHGFVGSTRNLATKYLVNLVVVSVNLVLLVAGLDPRNNSLTDMLPCPKSRDSDITLGQINHGVHDFIAEINSKIRELLASIEGTEYRPIPEICDPFSAAPSFSYSPQICRNDSIQVRNLPNDFIDIYPDMSGLMKCSAVKQAFSDIVQRQCKPLRRTMKVLWSSMLAFSIVMVVVVCVLWSDKAIRTRVLH
ncbi:UNVERIFIED_CONTAM: hypothetical protein Slati_1571900 [Sesamum latifolium]|uniref:Uncharacterized protein n=1 Tax=Sesamum latifolium TaxID=2727402 RepID=A0AAW2X9H0_9LAMI